jgi:CD109 antigen
MCLSAFFSIFRLTAFVLKSFAEASEFTYIDPAVIEKGVRFILEHQKTDGSFNSTGFVHNKAMQVGIFLFTNIFFNTKCFLKTVWFVWTIKGVKAH